MTGAMTFNEPPERVELRAVVSAFAGGYGSAYYRAKAKEDAYLTELWREAGKLGYLGVNLPEEYGGGGGGIGDLAAVLEELSAAGCPTLMMVVSPAICGTVLSRFGTPGQRERWLPGIATGETIMAFAITEPDAGSNSHRITTTARREGDQWVLNGRKTFISGVDVADAVLVVGRIQDEDTGRLSAALFVVPTDTPGFEKHRIEMDLVSPDHQYQLFLDDVRLPADALVGDPDAGLLQLFAGLNPERIMAASLAAGSARHALDKAVAYAKERTVWRNTPIGAHQGLAHPLAQVKIELEQARLMTQHAAFRYDSGDDAGAGEAANMAKYAAAEACVRAIDQAVQTLGGNGLASEYGLGSAIASARLARIAPVSREMVLNYVAQQSLGLPKSY
ncbi:acyl-CoA dehydrogenase family protein [Nocardiopsis changdeensis]|uniref:Acyl-CoA/acyl-ACP dehydrogenase n=1 Tax=Nocardiopsis changdeensis TaxID=2831969 RepID=A0ABX8BU99_9ACTN|nr:MULTISPECIES: acyl-CoA dehydrogenase family protein [Nocardiopsis]QUX24396.1 acyl-CoA/acyl-ACP dehydrogenase [Nocardiopsis changdeensis]QYX34787.1 acyl-CoA/acyl-ACP dehydrogenase [Nocardiopsis sp. MT53]